ncbi:MAG TPA: cell division protein FtsL [Syntrophomonadaceae bacterium]|nr:cell division protein FtsL [Syntrophomonadaceae bacterium]
MKIAARKNNKNKPGRLILLGLCLVLMAVAVVPRAFTVVQLNERKVQLEKQKQDLLARNQQLSQEKNTLNSPETVERIARERLGMLKNGERYILQKEQAN